MSPQSQIPSNYETFHLPPQMQQQVFYFYSPEWNTQWKIWRWEWWILALLWLPCRVLMGTLGQWEFLQELISEWTEESNEQWAFPKFRRPTITSTLATSKASAPSRSHTVRTATTFPSKPQLLLSKAITLNYEQYLYKSSTCPFWFLHHFFEFLKLKKKLSQGINF